MDCRQAKSIIQSNFTELKIINIRPLGEGWMSRTFLVNDQIVFRFPKNEEGAMDTKKEIKVLPRLKKAISLAIPEFLYVGEQNNGFPFVGYHILPGEPLDECAFQTLSNDNKNRIVSQLAEFVDEINTFDIQLAKKMDVPEKNFFQDYQLVFQKAKETVYPFLKKELQEYITNHFNAYLKNQLNFTYVPKLTHSDISLNHLMYDKQQEKLVGIIDFGDLQIGDPDFEYIYLYEECGEEFVTQVMKERREENISFKLKKASFFTSVDNVIQVLEGHKRNDKEMMDEALAGLEEDLKKNGGEI